MLNKLVNNKITRAIGSALLFPMKASKIMFSRFDHEGQLNEISKEIESYGRRHEVPNENHPKIGKLIKKDLLDKKGDFLVAPDGRPISAKLHDNDIYTGFVSPAMPVVYLLGSSLVALNMIFNAMSPSLSQYSTIALIAYAYFLMRVDGFVRVPSHYRNILVWFYHRFDGFFNALGFLACTFPVIAIKQTQEMLSSHLPSGLNAILGSFGTSNNLATILISMLPALWILKKTNGVVKAYYSNLANRNLKEPEEGTAQINKDRLLQAVNSAMDKSEILKLGDSLGVTAYKGDIFGPDKDQDFCVSHEDLRINAVIQGRTRAGKTSAQIKKIILLLAKAIYPGESKPDSLIIACGKNTLTKQMASVGIIDLRIHPKHVKLNWIHQFANRPEFISNEIVKAVQGKNAKNDHWTLSGKTTFECSLTIHRALIDMGHGNKSQQSYFNTIKEMQLSMSEAETVQETPELLEQLKGKTKEEIAQIKKDFAAKFSTAQKSSIINKLLGHPDLVNEKSMLFRAINNYEMIFAKTPEERSGVFSTLSAWIDMFTANESLNEMSTVEESEVIFKDIVNQSQNMTLEFAEDEFGPAGPIITKLIIKFMTSYMLNDREDNNKNDPYFHFIMDEAHLIANEKLADDMSTCLSKRFCFKLAFQMDESMTDTFGEAFLAKIKENCDYQATYNSSAATLKSFSESVGTTYTKYRTANNQVVDIVGTASSKAKTEWVNEKSINAKYLRNMFRSEHNKYVKGAILNDSSYKSGNDEYQFNPMVNYTNTKYVNKSKEPEAIFAKEDFTKQFSTPFVCRSEERRVGKECRL